MRFLLFSKTLHNWGRKLQVTVEKRAILGSYITVLIFLKLSLVKFWTRCSMDGNCNMGESDIYILNACKSQTCCYLIAYKSPILTHSTQQKDMKLNCWILASGMWYFRKEYSEGEKGIIRGFGGLKLLSFIILFICFICKAFS